MQPLIYCIAGMVVVSRIGAESAQEFLEQVHHAADEQASGPAWRKEIAEVMMFPHLGAMTMVNLFTI